MFNLPYNDQDRKENNNNIFIHLDRSDIKSAIRRKKERRLTTNLIDTNDHFRRED